MKVRALSLKPKDFYIGSTGDVEVRDYAAYFRAEVVLVEVRGDAAKETGLEGTYVIKNKYGYAGKVSGNYDNRNWMKPLIP